MLNKNKKDSFFQQSFKNDTLRYAYINLEHSSRSVFRDDVKAVVGRLPVEDSTWDKFFQSEEKKPLWISSPKSRRIKDVDVVLQLAAYFLIKGIFKTEDEAWGEYVKLAEIPDLDHHTPANLRRHLKNQKVDVSLLPRTALKENNIDGEATGLLRSVLRLIGYQEWNIAKPEVDYHTHEIHYKLPFSEAAKLRELAIDARERLSEKNVQRVTVGTYSPVDCPPSTNFIGLQALLDMCDYVTLIKLTLKIDDHFLQSGSDLKNRIDLLKLGEEAIKFHKDPEATAEIYHRLGTAYRDFAKVNFEEAEKRSSIDNARRWFHKAIEVSNAFPKKRAGIFLSFAALEIDKKDFESARRFSTEAFNSTTDQEIKSRAKFNIALMKYYERKLKKSMISFKECYELAIEGQAQLVAARAMTYQARIAYELDRNSKSSEKYLENALRLLQKDLSSFSLIEKANIHANLFQLYRDHDKVAAKQHYNEALELFRKVNPLQAVNLKKEMDEHRPM